MTEARFENRSVSLGVLPARRRGRELVRQLAIEYRDRGHDVTVVTNRWSPDLAEHEEVGGTDVYRFPLRLNDGPLQARLRYAMRQREVTRQIVTSMHRLNRPGLSGNFWPWKIKVGVHAKRSGKAADDASVFA